MKALALCLIALLLIEKVGFGDAAVEPADLEVGRLSNLSTERRREEISRMSSEHRSELLAVTKRMAGSAYAPSEFTSTLLNLGDQETMRIEATKLVYGNERESDSAARNIDTCRDARMIELIAPAMFLKLKPSANSLDFQRNFWTADMILKMLAETPGFSEDLYDWAKLAYSGTYSERLEIMQEWWRKNAAFFRAHDYKAVRPLARIPIPLEEWEGVPGPNGTWVLQRKKHPQEAKTLPTAPPSPTAGTSAQSQSTLARPPKTDHRGYVPVAAATFAAAGALILFLRSRRRN